jgi:hypothetical protein
MMAILDFIPKPVLFALLVIFGVATGYFYIDSLHSQNVAAQAKVHEEEIRNSHALMVIEAQKAQALAEDKARAAEYDLQIKMTEQRRLNDEKVSTLNADAAALKLRLAKARATLTITASPGPSSAPAGTPEAPGISDQPVLPDPVGGLVDEARRAELIRFNLLDCYKAYDTARDALK